VNFFSLNSSFLGYVVFKDGISMDQSKVEVIKSWPTSTSVIEARSFHYLAFLTYDFYQGFKTLVASIT